MPEDTYISSGGDEKHAGRAFFRFHGELEDFLSVDQQNPIPYSLKGNPTVKHAVESIGAPHTEVGYILLNGTAVGFSCIPCDGDTVDVLPVTGNWLYLNTILRRSYRGKPRFVLDVHLGTLARKLRLLGFDSLYNNKFRDSEIAQLAVTEERIVLTRDIGMLMWSDVTYGRWVRSQDTGTQFRETIDHFHLKPWVRPFHRCTICNGRIEKMNRAAAQKMVSREIWEHYTEFHRCRSCGRVYWKGTHFQRMEQIITECAGNGL
jgi:uncharacterized protein with PIN domain